MSDDYWRRTGCRLCESTVLENVLALTPTPPANAFVPADRLDEAQQVYPLDLHFCADCGHVQLLDVVDPEILFSDYVYVSGTSPVFVNHFREYAAAILERFNPPPGALAVDIGSNDGTLLSFFKDQGLAVLGIDPAVEIAKSATANGILTEVGFFDEARSAEIKAAHGNAAVITANNVFAHADDLAGIARGVHDLLADDGVFVFEVSYLRDVIDDVLFDTIYHEHLSYHSVGPLKSFFERLGLELIVAERVTSHGGSLRGICQLAGGPHSEDGSVAAIIRAEETAGLHTADPYRAFGARINGIKQELIGLLGELKSQGKKVAGFGAPAKATTLMYHFGIGPEVIDFIIDDSPLKQGLYTPGLHVHVVPSEALYARSPDAAVILAWNFADPIIDKHREFLNQGGRFIVPLPEIRVVTS
jgi:SAM-dependent methyltransferase